MVGKSFTLLKLFPEHASEMFKLMCTYDAVSKKKVLKNTPELIEYVLGFAVFHDLTVYAERCPELNLDKAVNRLYRQEFLLDDYDIRSRLGAYDGVRLLNTYDCPLRFVPTGMTVCKKYILAEKLSDFEYWANQQERVLKADTRKHFLHNVAMGNMLPAEKQIKQKQTPGNTGLGRISDEAMHNLATKLAVRRNVSDPDQLLLDMMYCARYVKTK